ncbi:hypothetical protein BH23THE1_BH23THE1_35570 [soil metagenome]
MARYRVIDNFISEENADNLMNLIDDITIDREGCDCPEHELQTIITLPGVSGKIWEKIKDYLIGTDLEIVHRGPKVYRLIGLSDSVTLSRHTSPIDIHRDIEGKTKFRGVKYSDIHCLYKIAIYLNDINRNPKCKSGGTILYDDNRVERVAVAPKQGRALIFDIRDLHSGAPIPPNKMKYLIGFRLLYHEIQK